MKLDSCSLGFRVKSGWAAVAFLGGPRKTPRLIETRIVALSDPAVPHARQPYHAGFGTAQRNAAKVARLVQGIERFSRRAIAKLVAGYREEHQVARAGVVVASLTDPATITNPHMRAHASEGRLFRTVLIDGLQRCGIGVEVILERDAFESLAEALRCPPHAAKARVAELGTAADHWRAEQKVAAAAAWLVR